MSLGFNPDEFQVSQLAEVIHDPYMAKRLVFSLKTRTVSSTGQQSSSISTSETTGIVESNPYIPDNLLKSVFPEGDVSREVVKVFIIDSLSFTLKNGCFLDVYKDSTHLGNFKVNFVQRNMAIPEFVISYCVSSR